ncbi:MAG: FAD binding domain-containing protein [Chloroflexi bacterium]|nr:FAD binding domain-containing protein [Chloroflexota bacterium]
MTKSEVFETCQHHGPVPILRKEPAEPRYIDHFDARTLESALELLRRYGAAAKIIAGGLDVIGLMRKQVIAPQVLVNIKTVPGLVYTTEDAEGLKIGALTTIRDVETSEAIRQRYPILAEAAHAVGSPLVRNMATIVGNLCQDVRCWYYRRSPATGPSFFCRRKGGHECYAVDGENAYHAIIGADQCHAVNPSDMAPALLALRASLKIASPSNDRVVPLAEFYRPMGNILQPDEIITEVQVPAPLPGTGQCYLKFRVRQTIDFAISSAAAVIVTRAGVASEARIVLGGGSPAPYEAFDAEATITGKAITESLAEGAARAAVGHATPLAQNAYKVPITEALVKRAILGCLSDQT